MPMCDIYIPAGALTPHAERNLVKTVSDLLVFHEMRRARELMEDPDAVDVSLERASSIAWMFVHRTETYVAGEPAAAPYYKFDVTIPQGTVDDRFPVDITRDIYAAVKEAEGGKHPHLSSRIWTHITERQDGFWGIGGRQLTLKPIVDFIAPGMGDWAVTRWEEKKRSDAVALVELASAGPAAPTPQTVAGASR